MKNAMLILLTLVLSSGCATVRTKRSDPLLRVAIDPTHLNGANYARIQNALFTNGMFQVVDRARGFQAARQEQDMTHRSKTAGRFGDQDRYAQWGKLYGIGGVIVADIRCQEGVSIWTGLHSFICFQNLVLVNATTGEVMAVGDGKAKTETGYDAPSWVDAVDALADNYPKTMVNDDDANQTIKYSSTLKKHRERFAREFKPQGRAPASDESDSDEDDSE